jgi:GDP-L-fucose synthase
LQLNSKIFIAGHRGLVGSAIYRHLVKSGYQNMVTRSRQELDLLDPSAVATFFSQEKPEFVFLAAAKVGGILANNTQPAEFIYQNLLIQNHVIHQAYLNNVQKLLFLGSSCIYPKLSPQPIKESYLLSGPLEETNSPYAIAKIAGIEMCHAYNRQYGTQFISAMPTNLYGPHDNFNLETSHVLPALIRRFHEAKLSDNPTVTLWGTGRPRREFLFVDDMAEAAVFLMEQYQANDIMNVGCGEDVEIAELANRIKAIIGFTGDIIYDTTKPDGTPQKRLDCTKINQLGWKASTSLDAGIRKTYDWFLSEGVN